MKNAQHFGDALIVRRRAQFSDFRHGGHGETPDFVGFSLEVKRLSVRVQLPPGHAQVVRLGGKGAEQEINNRRTKRSLDVLEDPFEISLRELLEDLRRGVRCA